MNLLEQIQDIFYDIIGFFVPGIFALALLLPLVLNGHSFAYAFFRNGPMSILFETESLLSAHNSVPLLVMVCFLGYLAGHLIRIIPDFFAYVHRRLLLRRRMRRRRRRKKKLPKHHLSFFRCWVRLLIKKRYSYIDVFSRRTQHKFRNEHQETWERYFHKCPDIKAMCKTYTSTNSRFKQHSNLISKYNNKKHFFQNLKIVSGFLLADFAVTGILVFLFDFIYLVSSLVLVYQGSSAGFIRYVLFGLTQLWKLVVVPTFIRLVQTFVVYLLYCTFHYEELRHGKLHKKELAFYLDSMLDEGNCPSGN